MERRRPQPRLVILAGPTGAGKSELAMDLAGAFGGEILSADSMQVYKGMDIGTDKPTLEDRKRVPHHLIDLVFPDEPFHAGLYRTLGHRTIEELDRASKPIWVAGGTGLYIKALTQGLFPSHPVRPEVRERLKREGAAGGGEMLYNRLRQVDPATALSIHPNDLLRIVRALEVYELTGVPISSLRSQHHFGERPYRMLKIGLTLEREDLYRRIDDRVERMMERGFLKEVEGLLEKGYSPRLKPMQGLGYKKLIQFLLKEIDWDEAVRQTKRDTRHYAKRQLTWFKADPEIQWQDIPRGRERIFQKVEAFLKEGGGKT